VKEFYDINPPKCKLEITPQKLTSHGVGAVSFNRIFRELGLKRLIKKKLKKKLRRRGYSDVCYVASLLASFLRGGRGLCGLDSLKKDKSYQDVVGLKGVPAPSSMGEYLRSFSQEELEVIYEILAEVVIRIIRRVGKGQILYNGWLYCFADGSLLEVRGRYFEGTEKRDYNGNRSLLWLCFYIGPFLANMRLHPGVYDQHGDFKELVEPFLKQLKKYRIHFFLDSAYYDHKVIEDVLEREGFNYTVSVNKAVSPLERLAEGLPSSAWETLRDDRQELRQVAELTHWPQGWGREHRYIGVRYRAKDEMFFHYYFILTNREDLSPSEVVELHAIKGDFENQQKNLLCDMGLHHPPMHSLNANRGYYTLAALAHNLLQGIKLLYLPPLYHTKRNHTLVHHVLQIPARVIKHARTLVVRLEQELIPSALHEYLLKLNTSGATTPPTPLRL